MEKKSFSTLSLTRLANDDNSTLLQLTIDVASPVKAEIGDMANVALTNFATNATPFIDQTNRLRESPLTIKINNIRTVNNEIVAEIKRIIVFEKKSRTEARKVAATDLDFFFKPYWNVNKRALGTQIKDTTELVGKYDADAGVVAKATIIGINIPMNELKESNASLVSFYLARNEEVGGRGTSGTDLRPAANDGYTQFCNVIEQSVNLMPNDTLVTLFNSMDALRVKAHALITKPKDKPEEGTENE
jgi:hypothetical protein